MADPLGAVAEVHRVAGLELTDEAREQIQAYIDSHPRDKGGSMTYDIRADFGVEPEELREKFRFYLDVHPVAPEVK